MILKVETTKKFTPEDAENALWDYYLRNSSTIEQVKKARLIERIYRAETSHFKSKQYVFTGTAGMEESPNWVNLPPHDTIFMNDTKKVGIEEFVVLTPMQFVQYLADYIDRHNGDYARWNSTIPWKKERYKKLVESVRNRTLKF